MKSLRKNGMINTKRDAQQSILFMENMFDKLSLSTDE